MTTDTRTEAEIAYDATALSRPRAELVVASDPTTIRDTIEAIWAEGESPSGEQIYELISEDTIARYAWMRAIDWVLYRLARGLPVQPMNDKPEVPAAIDAQFAAAAVRARTFCTPCPVSEQLNGNMIRRWEESSAPATDPAIPEEPSGKALAEYI